MFLPAPLTYPAAAAARQFTSRSYTKCASSADATMMLRGHTKVAEGLFGQSVQPNTPADLLMHATPNAQTIGCTLLLKYLHMLLELSYFTLTWLLAKKGHGLGGRTAKILVELLIGHNVHQLVELLLRYGLPKRIHRVACTPRQESNKSRMLPIDAPGAGAFTACVRQRSAGCQENDARVLIYHLIPSLCLRAEPTPSISTAVMMPQHE